MAQTKKALQPTEDSVYKKLIDNLNTAIIWLDQNLKIIYVNHAAEALFEVSGKNIIGDGLNALRISDNNPITSLVRAATEGAVFTEREATITLKSGHSLTVDCAVTPIQDAPVNSILLELQSIDRLVRISREESLLSTQSTSRKLIRGLAHEIKNPLGGIRGAAQLLSRQHDDIEDYTTIIIEEADRLRNLVDSLLGPNKIMVKQANNIHEVLDRVMQLISAENESIIIKRDFDPSIPEIISDKEQLIQATLNIARNAMQALIENDVSDPTIKFITRIVRQFTISDKRHRLVCSIKIIDNGPGIPDDIVNELFFPMVSGRPEGTGLGLSIAQSVAQRHSGLIACESRPGKTCFTIYIPLEY